MQRIWAKIQFMYKGYWNYGINGYNRNSLTWDDKDLSVYNVLDKCFIITGANSGIGYEAALGIANCGGEVHLLCRSKERGEKAKDDIISTSGNNNIFLHIVDVSEPSSVIQFVEDWYAHDTIKPVHCLINNAGVLLNEKNTNSEGMESTFATNLLGGYILTQLMMPSMSLCGNDKEPSRVINISSGGMYTKRMELDNIENYPHPNYDGVDAYANTKRAQAYLNEIWAKMYKNKYIHFYAMHPGWSATPGVAKSLPSFNDKLGDKLRTPQQGADTIVWLAVSSKEPSPKLESGLYYFDREQVETHFMGAGTQSTAEEINHLWEILEGHYKSKIDNISPKLENILDDFYKKQ